MKQVKIGQTKLNFSILWALAKKNIALYIKSGPVLIFGLMFPFFLTLSWVIGRNIGPIQIFVGIVAMTSFFTATAISPVILPIETREKSLERVISSPVSLWEVLLGIVVSSFLYSVIISIIIALIFFNLLSLSLLSFLHLSMIIIAIILMGVVGSLLGLMISANPTDKTSDVMVMMNLIKFPLIFISGIFLSFESLPPLVVLIAFLSPVSFIVDILRFATSNQNFFPLPLDFFITGIWIIALLYANYFLHKRTILRRFSAGQKKVIKKPRSK